MACIHLPADQDRVRIENRRGLEKAACECYAVICDEYVRLGLL